MDKPVKKVIIEFHDNVIPVYCMDDRRGTIDALKEVLERKWKTGRQLVQRFLSHLDSVEIEGSEAILYSKRERGTLALSLY
ncbi:3-dehydroquinate dehydratase [Cohnella sp. CFH 77786]|uniref:3-dehydroquinate dehydratase n=1 Tax=Cohnella sp. CFH 77786 TaxID=2662265 RepID=UPI001C60B0E7|nr:3-dehydroquinate dehydratase [Cohnella sp. CFH 77786]MBW5447188.1 3-dehydroquinate dehydratase [Cohnella sp. CFH 77786]